jgi:hypothetical protein
MDIEQPTEVYVKKVLAGDVESVRRRLMDALETLGYDLIEEEPNIIGRRTARSWATWTGSANVLDYPVNVTIRLKKVGENSTQAVFDYLIKHAMLTKGDKNIILQEARTIAAISKVQSIEKLCSVCETESTDDSKFCRKCGAPLTSEQSELEVLRMMAEVQAGKVSVVTSSLGTVISTMVIILTLILNNAELLKPKLFPVLLVFGGVGMLISIISSFFGWNRMNRALEKPETTVQHIPREPAPKSRETGEFEELPPRQPVASITEGTTNLLDEEWVKTQQKEKVPVSKRRETNDLD